MIKTDAGTNDDGTPRFNFALTQEEHDEGFAAFITGPIAGTITVPDGTAYDVTEYAIPVKAEHVGQLHVAIHKAHHATGRFTESPVPELAQVSVK